MIDVKETLMEAEEQMEIARQALDEQSIEILKNKINRGLNGSYGIGH